MNQALAHPPEDPVLVVVTRRDTDVDGTDPRQAEPVFEDAEITHVAMAGLTP